MLKSISGTFITRVAVAVTNFIIIIVTSRILGAEARGEISLCMLAVAITSLFNEIIGGPAMVYMVPRVNNRQLQIWSYVWATAISLTLPALMGWLKFYPPQFYYAVTMVSFLLCTGSVHLFVLLGRQQIVQFNMVYLVQGLLVLIPFFVFTLMHCLSIQNYLISLLLSYSVAFLLGFYLVQTGKDTSNVNSEDVRFGKLFSNGCFTQMASLTHMLSSRVMFYFTDYLLGSAYLGKFSTAIALTEAVLLLSSSISLITASGVANSNDKALALKSTLFLIKLSLVCATGMLLVLLCVPDDLLGLVFGKDFTGISLIIRTLIPAAAAMSLSQVISHYYSGMGQFKVNTMAGAISLGSTLVGATILFLLKDIALPGLVVSFGAIVTAVFFVVKFTADHSLKANELLPKMIDLKEIKKRINMQFHF